MMKKAVLVLSLIAMCSTASMAQDVTVAFDLSTQGQRFQPTWGLDQAWYSEQNMRKGINHMGKENIGIGRSCFRTTKPLEADSALASDQTNMLRRRATLFNLVSPTLPLVLTADQEAGSDEYFVKNKSCDTEHWAAAINSHVHWMQQNSTHPVVGVSIFNEPDYWTVEEGATPQKQAQVAQLLRQQYPRMDSVAIVGANTLNNDKALSWYTNGSQWYDWGNTHQLAGSFDTFAAFFQHVQQDGKVGYADEMHNVGEAMIGLEYGMTVGIWWGFDSRARGEFCDISLHGERLAYGEHRPNWTAASVYRHDDGRVKAFIGSSERQAATTSYRFVSLDRDVYFDGNGPLRTFTMEIPGGTDYQKGQTNAERVIDITWGEDVAPKAIEAGIYKLVNKATGNAAAVSGDNIVMQRYTGSKAQQWNVALIDSRIGGDYSFYDIRSANNGKTCMDVLNFATTDNANVIAYTPSSTPSSNQQWYLQYAGNGYYYIRNRESALYLAAASSQTNNGENIVQRTMQTDPALHERLLWRLLPSDIKYETEAPAQPTGLSVELLPTAINLTWDTGSETDIDGYMVLRAEMTEGETPEWNTIARWVQSPFMDNTCQPGRVYLYKVKAIDRAQNMSTPSEEIQVTTSDQPALVGWWPLDGSLLDATSNNRHATTANEATYTGDEALLLNQNQYMQLPPSVVQGEELTVAMRITMLGTKAWNRLFDFGYDDSHCLFLTPTGGNNKMRLVIRNGDTEQYLECPSRLASVSRKHVVLTMKPGSTAIYVDGELIAHTDAITLSPADVKPVLNYIGRSQTGEDPLLTGYLDDLRIYNYALTADNVKQLYDKITDVDTPTADDGNQPDAIHSLDGIRLQQPRHGLNIINGKVKAVK